MKTAIMGILVALAFAGAAFSSSAFADDWKQGRQTRYDQPEVVPRGQPEPKIATISDDGDGVVGENQPRIGGMFDDTPPAACEMCGGGGCLPPTWTIENSIGVMAMARPTNRALATNSLPGGPFPATSSGTATNAQYLNDVPLATFQLSLLEVHSLNTTASPQYGLTLSHFLGRDGESRDHFIDFGFSGLNTYAAGLSAAGSTIPRYDTTPFPTTTTPVPSPVVTEFYGSMISPFPTILDVNGRQSGLPSPIFSTLGANYDKAFNRSDAASANYFASYNEWEMNYIFAGHNQPDQLVMHPNGRWYRQCQTGYYYKYFFGTKMMVINETFDYAASGNHFDAVATVNPDGTITYAPSALPNYTHQGSYAVSTHNTLLGLQTGGTLEYRFCRWKMEAHSNLGMFLNFANQNSRILTAFNGTRPLLADGITTANDTDTSFSASSSGVAFAGGFGVAGSYKFLPNVVGHVSYDMLFVGDLARAPEQINFSLVPENGRGINTKGSDFYNGFTFGLELDW